MKQYHSLGQVFLNNQTAIEKIIKILNPSRKNILEIGPGRGQISEILAKKARNFYAVEIDKRLASLLKNKFKAEKNVSIFQADILKFPISELKKKLTIFGNIPYQISKKIIYYLIENRKLINFAYLTVQKEFAQKLIAKPSSKAYGSLTCYLQYYAVIEKLFDIQASAFVPVPKVDSTFCKISFYQKSPYDVKDVDFLFKVIHKAFSNRRKKIINSLPDLAGDDKFFSSFKMSPNLRAENISLREYILIANRLYHYNSFWYNKKINSF